MTATSTRPSGFRVGPRRTPDTEPIPVGTAYPAVDLLPQTLRTARSLRELRRRLLLLPLAAVLVVALGWSGSIVAQAEASSEADQARAERARLNDELAKYSDITKSVATADKIESARNTLMAGEIDWVRVINAIEQGIPAGSTVSDISRKDRSADTQGKPEPGITGVTDAVGQLSFTLRGPKMPDVASMLDAINSSQLLAGATYQSLSAGDDGTYAGQVTAYVKPKALTGRFGKPHVSNNGASK